MPQTDDRERDSLSSKIYIGAWDSVDQHDALLQYAGAANFGTNRLGPEHLASHATIEECIGYPATTIITVEYGQIVKAVLDKAINDCFNYDLNRPWVAEEGK